MSKARDEIDKIRKILTLQANMTKTWMISSLIFSMIDAVNRIEKALDEDEKERTNAEV